MKTKMYLLLLFIMTIALNSCQQKKKTVSDLWEVQRSTDIEKFDLKGKIKKYSSKHYDAHSDLDKIILDSIDNYSDIVFDENGYIVELKDSNRLYNNSLFMAQCKNKKSKKICDVTMSNGNKFRIIKHYDNDLLTKVEKLSLDNELVECTEVIYNDDKLAVEMVARGKQNKIISKKYNCKFDDNGNYTSYTHSMGENLDYSFYNEFKYDSLGNIQENLVYDVDSLGNKQVLLHKGIYVLSNEGKPVIEQSIEYDYSGNLINKYKVEYNENGDVIKYMTLNDDDTILRMIMYDLKYDDQGNIIERVTYLNNNLSSVTHNDYIYY